MRPNTWALPLVSETILTEMKTEENQKAWKWGYRGLLRTPVGSRGNAPGRGQETSPPEAEGFF